MIKNKKASDTKKSDIKRKIKLEYDKNVLEASRLKNEIQISEAESRTVFDD